MTLPLTPFQYSLYQLPSLKKHKTSQSEKSKTDPDGTKGTNSLFPLYSDESSLLHFVEEFLDLVVEEKFEIWKEEKTVSGNKKYSVVSDIIGLLEIDRCLIKFMNHCIN